MRTGLSATNSVFARERATFCLQFDLKPTFGLFFDTY